MPDRNSSTSFREGTVTALAKAFIEEDERWKSGDSWLWDVDDCIVVIGKVLAPLLDVAEAAQTFAKCSHFWDALGYPTPSVYDCLTRERDIADPNSPTSDWWPHGGPCAGCELKRALDAVIPQKSED